MGLKNRGKEGVRMKLGTSVKCKGYLRKVNTVHIVPYFEDLDNDQHYLHFGGTVIEEDTSQKIKEFIECEFEGIVVSKKSVATERYFYLGENEWTGKEFMSVRLEEPVYCYQVFFRMGGSRLVPVDKCEVVR